MTDILDTYRSRKLDPAAGYKPLDFGGRGIIGSVDWNGRFIAVNRYHPLQGFITLSAAAPFPDQQRYDRVAVRAYRASLVQAEGFGLRFSLPIVKREAWMLEDAVPYICLTLENDSSVCVATFVSDNRGFPVVTQVWFISDPTLQYYWDGNPTLYRSAYTQLTEGGPIPPLAADESRISLADEKIVVENGALPAKVTIFVPGFAAGADLSASAANLSLDDRLSESLAFQISKPTTRGHEMTLAFENRVDGSREARQRLAAQPDSAISALHAQLAQSHEQWADWQLADHPLDAIVRRGLVYGLCCCIPLNDDAICIITDHQILPLSWNRDSYYVARTLLAWRPQNAEIMRRHLIWMFEVAERPDGYWGRAYLANGKLKDAAFQLDQQLFPLLELAEYVAAADDRSMLERLRPHVMMIMEMLLSQREQHTGLFPTAETPADDPVSAPFHLSSHILLWHTVKNIAQIVQDTTLHDLTHEVYAAIWQHFVAESNHALIFAYLTDGNGNHEFYHDANDLPVALAPRWGFCDVNEPVWRATMNFAFSPFNEGGYYPGPYGGLGSLHTPAPWPLGDVQEYIYARLINDQDREKQIVERLLAVAQSDGTLSEAYSAQTGQIASRHWFAWPGAALALEVLSQNNST